LDADFVGPIRPESIRRFRYGLLIICPKTKKFFAIPIRHKSDNTDRFRLVLQKLRARYGKQLGAKILYFVRTDNEPVWEAEFARWLASEKVMSLRPPPYCPQINGVIERMVRTCTEGIRSMLSSGVDRRLWCYAMEMFALVWSSVHENKQGFTPDELCDIELLDAGDPRRRVREHVLDQSLLPAEPPTGTIPEGEWSMFSETREDRLARLPFRKFGSLVICYKEDPIKKRQEKAHPLGSNKWACAWTPGVYLGVDPKSSNPLVGVYVNDRFTERRERHV
jgi:hypothetical protein